MCLIVALVTRSVRSATCTAVTEVCLLHVARAEFLNILRGETQIVDRIFHVARLRLTTSWAAICSNSVLKNLSNAQQGQIEAALHYMEAVAGQRIWRTGDELAFAVLVSQGRLKNSKTGQEFTIGALVGCRTSLGSSFSVTKCVASHDFDLVAVEDTSYFVLNRDSLNAIYQTNPGIRLSLMHKDAVL
jgi:CRP-like cAMP-binding protein